MWTKQPQSVGFLNRVQAIQSHVDSMRPHHPATVQNLDSRLRIGWRVDKTALAT